MPVPSDITALSTTAASNSPAGSESPATADDYFRAHAAFIAQLRAVIGGATNPDIPTATGTAAAANLTTSATDTTAGRVLKVGDFGLGTTAVLYGGDLNLIGNVTGFYRTILGATNFPDGCLDSCFVHIGSGDTFSQTFVGYGTNRMYTRGGVGVVPNISWQPWAEVATSANSFGQGQTWQDVTGSRALNTVYTNSTGKPIQIKVSALSSQSSVMQTFINGNATGLSGSGNLGSIPADTSTIPNGATYRCTVSDGTPSALKWWELR